MKPDDEHAGQAEVSTEEPSVDPATPARSGKVASEGDTGWRLWPPSPKMQIAMIALGFGLFNLVLLAIWALVMVYRF